MYNFFKRVHENKSLEQFIDELTTGKLINPWFYPQHRYIKSKDYQVNDIIRIESFEEDWNRVIKETLGIDIDMLHVNKTKEVKVDTLTLDQKERVYEYYKEDFIVLGYDK